MKNTQLDHQSHQASATKLPLCFLAHNINDPINIGSLFRIADALGVSKIFLTGSSAVPPNPKIKKTSRSTDQHVDYECRKEPTEVISQLKTAGYKIISLEITSTSLDIRKLQIQPADKICLIPGSENRGVDQTLLSLCDSTIHIPMQGNNSSMNVANATAIATFEIFKGLTSTGV